MKKKGVSEINKCRYGVHTHSSSFGLYIVRGALYGSFYLEVLSKGYCILHILITLVVLYINT